MWRWRLLGDAHKCDISEFEVYNLTRKREKKKKTMKKKVNVELCEVVYRIYREPIRILSHLTNLDVGLAEDGALGHGLSDTLRGLLKTSNEDVGERALLVGAENGDNNSLLASLTTREDDDDLTTLKAVMRGKNQE